MTTYDNTKSVDKNVIELKKTLPDDVSIAKVLIENIPASDPNRDITIKTALEKNGYSHSNFGSGAAAASEALNSAMAYDIDSGFKSSNENDIKLDNIQSIKETINNEKNTKTVCVEMKMPLTGGRRKYGKKNGSKTSKNKTNKRKSARRRK
jgi:hypothetical protein